MKKQLQSLIIALAAIFSLGLVTSCSKNLEGMLYYQIGIGGLYAETAEGVTKFNNMCYELENLFKDSSWNKKENQTKLFEKIDQIVAKYNNDKIQGMLMLSESTDGQNFKISKTWTLEYGIGSGSVPVVE